MITNKHISCGWKCKSNSTICSSNQKWNNKTCQFECKDYRKCKKDYRWNHSTCPCENYKYLKSLADTSVITCDEIISLLDIVSIKMINTIATNVSINSNDKKVISKVDCYILHTLLLAIVLLLINSIICYHYASHRSKAKTYCRANNIK